MADTTRLNLDAIRRRAAAATPGPWVAGWRSLPAEQVMLAPSLPPVEFSCDAQGRKNARFAAHARQDVDTLLAEVERLTEERDRAVRSLRDQAAQEVLIDTHRVPMAISEAIAALPLLPAAPTRTPLTADTDA